MTIHKHAESVFQIIESEKDPTPARVYNMQAQYTCCSMVLHSQRAIDELEKRIRNPDNKRQPHYDVRPASLRMSA